MPFNVEIDQSTKLEQSGPTVLAFSNDITRAILVPSRVKEAGFAALLAKGKSRNTALLILFAASVYLLVEEYLDKVGVLEIDVEYTGKNADVRAHLLRFIRRKVSGFEAERIRFKHVGKASPADKKARRVREGRDKKRRKITLREMLAVVA